MLPIKVLFLDFDGVLNSSEWFEKINPNGERTFATHEEWQRESFDPEAIARLNRVLDATGAVVVISSSWRIVNSINDLRIFLRDKGFTGKIIGTTPILRGERERGDEIQMWLHKKTVEKFAIVDDSDDMAHLKHRLVRTTWKSGLQDEHVEALIKMLNE
jgi:hypothetical protein